MILLVWGGALTIYFVLRHKYKRTYADEWNWPGLRAGIGIALLRLACLVPVLAVVTYIMMPERFLSFPLQRTEAWVRVMALYPLLSVLPQELIYRSFLRYRYEPLFGAGWGYIAASTAAFDYISESCRGCSLPDRRVLVLAKLYEA